MSLVTRILVVAMLLVVPVSAVGQSGSAPGKADIQKLLQERDDARHKGDWKAYAKFFTADATVVNSDGKSYKGRAQLQKGTQDAWNGVYKGARMTTTVESFEVVAPNVLVVDAAFDIANIPGGGSRTGRTTLVLVRSTDGWKVAASRSMVPTPSGAIRTSR